MNRKIPRDGNTSRSPLRLTSPVRIGGEPSVSLTRTGSQNISSPSGSIGPVEVRNSQPFHTSINGNSYKHRDPAPNFSKVIGCKLSNDYSADIYSRCRMKFTRDAVLTEIPNFMNLGLSSVHTLDELGSFSIPGTRIGSNISGSNWLPPGYLIGEVTPAIMSRTRSKKKHNSKTYFETRREINILSAKIIL